MSAQVSLTADSSFRQLLTATSIKPVFVILDKNILMDIALDKDIIFDVRTGVHGIALQQKWSCYDASKKYGCKTIEFVASEGAKINIRCFADHTDKRIYLSDTNHRFHTFLIKLLVRYGSKNNPVRDVILTILQGERAVGPSMIPNKDCIRPSPQSEYARSSPPAMKVQPVNNAGSNTIKEKKEILPITKENYTQFLTEVNSCNSKPQLLHALDIYNMVIKVAPPSSSIYNCRAELNGKMYSLCEKNSFLDSAIEDVSTAIVLDPDMGEYYRHRGSLLWSRALVSCTDQKSQLEAALLDYKASLSMDPVNPMAWLDLMAITICSGDFDEAISLYGQCSAYMSSAVQQLTRAYLGCSALILQGEPVEDEDMAYLSDNSIVNSRLMFRDKQIIDFLSDISNEKKRELIRKLSRLFISHYSYWYSKGQFFIKFQCFEDALMAYDEGIKANPGDALLKLVKCDILKALNRPLEVLMLLEEILKSNSKNIDIMNRIGDILKELGRHREAAEVYGGITEISPADPLAWYNKGVALKNIMRNDEALICFQKAIDLDHGYAAACNEMGNVLVNLFRYNNAIMAFDKALRLNPNDIWALQNKSTALRRLNRYPEALECLIKIKEINPQSAKAWVDIGKFLFNTNRFQESLEYFDKAIFLDAGSSTSVLEKGIALSSLKRNEEALTYYRKAVELDPRHVNAWVYMGNQLGSLGRNDEAFAAFNKAATLDPNSSFLQFSKNRFQKAVSIKR